MLWDTLDPFFDDRYDGVWLVTIDRCLLRDCGLRAMVREDGLMRENYPWPAEPEPILNVSAAADESGQVTMTQKAALEHLIANASAYEARILAWFDAKVKQVTAQALEGDFDEVRNWVAANPGRPLPGVKDQLLLKDIFLHSDGWDGVGCITFDFRCGWEEEHGASLVMHAGRTIAEGGQAEFMGAEVLEAARFRQQWQSGFDIVLP